MKIKEIPKKDRPREKALTYGIETISDAELLAIIIGSGVKNKSALDIANSLIDNYKNLLQLSNSNNALLMKEFGLSQISALKLEATFEFCHRLNKPKYKDEICVNTSNDLYELYRYLGYENQELFIVVMLNHKGMILKEKTIYRGTNNRIEINLQEILRELLMVKAKYFAIIHNHPSGNCFPSKEDEESTIIIAEKAKFLGLKLFDHLIICSKGYYSFMNRVSKKNW